MCGGRLLAQDREPPQTVLEFKKLSVQELMDIEVTSVSKSVEHLGGAAAAIAVVTSEDIRRSGATSVPEALRMVPGLHVARQSSDNWAVSARGFNSINSEKLLVLSDTRSIYTPLFSGVFWDAQDYLMQDIDRIEVIRGPGATLWGANAVNGVINITTKSAKNTQGLYVEANAGMERELAAVGTLPEFRRQGYATAVNYLLLEEFFARPRREGEITDERLRQLAQEFPLEAIASAFERSSSHGRSSLTAVLAGLPLFFGGIGSLLCGVISFHLARWTGSVAKTRRAMAIVGFVGASILLFMSSLPKDPIWAALLMGLASFAGDLTLPGSWGTCMDVGQEYAGTLSGSMNMMGNLGGSLAPLSIPYILAATNNNWAMSFYVGAAVYLIGAVCWLFLDSVTPIDNSQTHA